MKFRAVYVTMSQFGIALSTLVVLTTVAIGLNSLDTANITYTLVVLFIVAQIMMCLAAMKYYMNKRQLECENTPIAPNFAESRAVDNKSVEFNSRLLVITRRTLTQ